MQLAVPAADLKTRLHRLIESIQDPDVLQAAWVLLLPQLGEADAESPAVELSAAWLAELDRQVAEVDANLGQGVPFREALAKLQGR